MTVYLVRHAKAGARQDWDGRDELRPLSKTGRRQADALADAWAETLADGGVTQIISSPYVRCRQTVEPLAARLQLPVDITDALAEGAPLALALRAIEKVSDTNAVLCSHGDVIGEVLHHAHDHGVVLPVDRLEKCSVWVLELDAGAIVDARYVPPPSA